MVTAASGTDFGVAGVQPEPRAGYHDSQARERSLEAFSRAVWQRHGHGGHRPGPTHPWPTGSFHVNWPLLAVDLIIANWKIAGAAAADSPLVEEIDVDLLDPPPAPERDWREVFAVELASHPSILEDLERGAKMDGVELVLERAGLTASERLVIRGWLAGDDAATIAVDLSWRPQTVIMLLTNARIRLEDVGRWSKPRMRLRRDGPVTFYQFSGS
jgi:hypothetical protein